MMDYQEVLIENLRLRKENYEFRSRLGLDVWKAQTSTEVVDDIFSDHNDPTAVPRCVEIREAGKVFAKAILRHAPVCQDQGTAVERVREAVMFANAAITLGGRGL